MARVNVYLPDELAEEVRTAGLNVSAVAQEALRAELSQRQTDEWLAHLAAKRSMGVTHDTVLAVLDAVREEDGDTWPEPVPGG